MSTPAATVTEHYVLGMMSGSSLDGLDLAVCRFQLAPGTENLIPDWEIVVAETAPFPPLWRARLRSAPHLPGRELWRLHADLGHWVGQRAAAFLRQHPELPVALAGSHGHTIFHEPDRSFTTQIGDGAAIAYHLGLPTVTELRGADIAAGGQGAPLAPLADKHLFPSYPAFVNLGGIANISVRTAGGDYLAGDVTGCCQILDRLAQQASMDYDEDGRLASTGSLAPATAQKIAALPYHQLDYPKSLGNAWVREDLWPILDDASASTADLLHTFVRWLAQKIAHDLSVLSGADAGAKKGLKSKGAPIPVLLSGGGSRNKYLVDQLRATQDPEQPFFDFHVPEASVVDFKEAALIALAALLRRERIANALPGATGAERPTINGAMFI